MLPCPVVVLAELINVLTSLSLGPVYVNAPVALLYVNEPKPPASTALTLPRALAAVKYKFVPSPMSVVVSVLVPPNETAVPLMVIELFVRLLFGIALRLNTPVPLL